MTGVDYVYTDVWVSMGEPIESWGERIDQCLPFQVNRALMAATGNPRVKFLLCLRRSTTPRRRSAGRSPRSTPTSPTAIEVTEDVFESPANLSFEQAENRMHTIKALLVASLA